MSKIELQDTNSGYNLQKINNNFDKIETEFNEKVLYRDNPDGEPNEMLNDLDMNGNRIYNLPPPAQEHEAARLKDVQDAISGRAVAKFVEFDPYKDISSTNVQGAIQETKDDIDTLGEGLQSVKEVVSTYRDKNDLKDLGINGTLLVGGGFPRSMSDELSDNYSGNNPELVLTRQAPVDLAQCSFVPSNEISSNFVHSNFPWMNIGGTMKRLMAVDIRTNLFNSPVNIPLFKPTRTNGSGILSFRYIGDKPIHTVIQGSLNILIRSSMISDEPYSRVILRLESLGHPHLEEGENGGRRSLGVSLGGFREPFYIENYKEFNDLCFPINQHALDNAALYPNLYVGSDNGFFSSNFAPDTEALATADDDGPVGPEVRTTKWMDVETHVQNRRRFLMNFTGTSTRTRVQYKDEDGNISIYTSMNAQGGSRRIYRLPHNAKFARIYYSGRGDTVNESSIEFRPLGPETSTEYDPLAGRWSERIIPVHRDIVLWPGVEYWFSLFTQAYESASAREWGYRVQSGGLSFLFDSGGIRKNIASTFWEK